MILSAPFREFATGFKLTNLRDFFERIGIRHDIAHLDFCHAGGIFLGDSRAGAAEVVLERMGKAPVVQAVTAVTADEEAFERDGNGFFTRTLCDLLASGDIFEKHRRAFVTGTELFSSVKELIVQQTRGRMTPMHKTILARHGEEQCYGEMLFVRPRVASPAGSPASESAAERV